MPDWVNQATGDYIKRLPSRWKFEVREFSPAVGANAAVVKAKEASALLGVVPEKSHLVALDNRGQTWSTRQTADQLSKWQALGKNLILVVGGADGLDDKVLERADQAWCLSPLTFPHPLVRVILAEQLYRAQSLLDNHPYHRS